MDGPFPPTVSCSLCGHVHRAVPLRRTERALCVQCANPLPRRPRSPDTSLALTLTALILALAAVQMPLVIVRKFGAEHASYLWTGVRALWANGMPLLSVWVALCGIVVPLTLVATLTMLVSARSRGPHRTSARVWTRAARALQHWSMPEVQILAVLVAFTKIGALVNVEVGPGLWFYAAMTVAMLLAWRSTEQVEVEL